MLCEANVEKLILVTSVASYGSLARFKDIQRLHPVGLHTVLGAGGDMSDFQYIQTSLDTLLVEEEVAQNDGHTLGPAEIHEYLKFFDVTVGGRRWIRYGMRLLSEASRMAAGELL